MPDGFPNRSNDSDFQIQEWISLDLANAQALWAAFHDKHSGTPEPATLGFPALQRKAPEGADLYPRATRQANPEWLTPMLRRLRWQDSQGQKVKSIQIDMMWMVNHLMRKIRPVTVEQFVALAEHAGCFEGVPAAH